MQIAIPLFDRLTALDAIGPYEVLSRLPGAEVLFVAAQPGPKRTDTGALGRTADRGLSEVPQPDIVVVPGGRGTRDQNHDDDVSQALQLSIEYDPQPPFDAGSPAKAPARIVELVRGSGAAG